MDVDLRRTQSFWETPRNLVIVVGAAGAIAGVAAGFLGYKIGQTPGHGRSSSTCCRRHKND
jgi:hypothetical protein